MKITVGKGLNITGVVAESVNARAAGRSQDVHRASVEALRSIQERSNQGAIQLSPHRPGGE